MKFKNLNLKQHNINKVVELIIETEPSFFYLLFGKNKVKSFSRIKNLIMAGKNSFGHEFVLR
jgi:hypothetical protein